MSIIVYPQFLQSSEITYAEVWDWSVEVSDAELRKLVSVAPLLTEISCEWMRKLEAINRPLAKSERAVLVAILAGSVERANASGIDFQIPPKDRRRSSTEAAEALRRIKESTRRGKSSRSA